MIVLRPGAFIFFITVLLASCGGEKKTPVDPLTDLDTVYVKKGSEIEMHRYRTLLIKEPDIMSRLPRTYVARDTGTRYIFSVDSGMLIYNNKNFTALCFVKKQPVKYLVDSMGAIVTRLPHVKLPASYFRLSYKGSFFPENLPTASCFLNTDDSAGLLNNTETKVERGWHRIHLLHTTGYLDGQKWNLLGDNMFPFQVLDDSTTVNAKIWFTGKHKQRKQTK